VHLRAVHHHALIGEADDDARPVLDHVEASTGRIMSRLMGGSVDRITSRITSGIVAGITGRIMSCGQLR
jgi:hypothetical protein